MPEPQSQFPRRRRIWPIVVASVAVLSGAAYLPLTLLAPIPEIVAEEKAYDVPGSDPVTIEFPGYGAAGLGAVGFDGVLAYSGSRVPLPMASITKVITALVVLEASPLKPGDSGPSRVLTEQDAAFYEQQIPQDGSREPVPVGTTYSQRTMLDLMLMASANNYALSLSSWFFGSDAEFLNAARGWLDDHGLDDTTVTDPTGILPTNTSSVADLLELAKIALDDPVISEIVGTALIDVPGIGPIDNSNKLLGIDGIDGVKTGTLDEAGACLLFSADYSVGGESITLVGVVLGGPTHAVVNDAVRALLAQAEAGFREVTVAEEGEQFASYETAWGDEAAAVAAESASLLVWSDTPIESSSESSSLRLGEQGLEVGSVEFSSGNRSVSVPLVLDATIDDPGFWWRLANPIALL